MRQNKEDGGQLYWSLQETLESQNCNKVPPSPLKITPLKIISLNVRGLHESKKRSNIFIWFRMNKYDIIQLQETYIYCKQDTETITRECGGRHLWSFGDFKSRGVGILFPESFKGKIDLNSTSTDQEGRILSVMVEINDTTFQVCNVYCPTHSSERSEFLDKLLSYIKGNIPLITGGDWNCVENPKMDKFGATQALALPVWPPCVS